MEKKYIAKNDAWFDKDSEAVLIEYMHKAGGEHFGNFEGTYTVGNSPYDTFWHKKGHAIGDKVTMTEVCSYNEFEISNKLPDDSTINKLAFDYVHDAPKDFVDSEDVKVAEHVWKLGFKAGFKYLDDGLEKK